MSKILTAARDTIPERVRDPRVFVNDDRTVLLRIWANGVVEVAHREEDGIWGPPIRLKEDKF